MFSVPSIISELIIPPLDKAAMKAVRQHLDSLAKPQGSLGRLETLAVQLAGVQGRSTPTASPAAVAVMAGDHGVTAEGVSAYPSEVTAQMVYNFLRGGAAINVFSRQMGARVYVVDVGVQEELVVDPNQDCFFDRKVCSGTANMTVEPAMTPEQATAAIGVGMEIARRVIDDGAQVLAVGEMGIGNSTAAVALVCALHDHAPAKITGRGTGVDQAGWLRKVSAIERALELHALDPKEPFRVLCSVGGLEIAAMAGYVIQGAQRRRPVVIDGLISTSAALVAVHLCPAVRDYLIPSHLSQEPLHAIMLDHLGLSPLLHIDMRLGEGTGAVLALPLLEAAVNMLTEMATFSQAGVSTRDK
ncbi:MAG: nicotinate-nucleotide--dimethylbenzimidazole phosphoribosyltransferase [Limnochordia bacterium]